MEKENLTPAQLDEVLNKKSGLLGIAGYSDDRDVTKAEIEGDPRAILAHEMLTYQIIKHIGAYTAAMNGVNAIVFTAGLGENQAHLRYAVCRGLKYLGLKIDPEMNDKMVGGAEGKISTFDSQVAVYVIPTNEELVIARDTKEIVEKLNYASTEDKTVVDLEDI
jgi:acetate kinase